MPRSVPSAPAPVASSADRVPVTVAIAVARSASGKRTPKYVSPGTQSFTVTVNGTLSNEIDVDAQLSSCSATTQTVTCSAQVDAPVGSDTFAIALYASSGGRGSALATGTTTQTIQRGTANTVGVALLGIPARLSVTLGNPNPVMGARSSTTVTVTAYDAANFTITGNTYATPLTLRDSDTSGGTALSVTTIAGPGDAPPALTYDGTSYVNATIDATIGGGSPQYGQSATLVPVLRAAEYPVPSGNATSSRFGDGSLAVGSDGAIWFIDDSAIGRVTSSGSVTEFGLASATPYGITAGPDGALWFTKSGPAIGRITTAGAQSTFFGNYGTTIVTGADGNLWSLAQSTLPALQKTTASGTTTTVPLVVPGSSTTVGPAGLVSASDGNLWTVDEGRGMVRVTPSGTITEYALPSTFGCCSALPVGGVTTGTDGAIWLVTYGGVVGRFTTDGTLTNTYTAPRFPSNTASVPFAQAADHAFWFAVVAASTTGSGLERFDPATGAFATFIVPASAAQQQSYIPQVSGLIAGPDGNLWYTRATAVGRVQLH